MKLMSDIPNNPRHMIMLEPLWAIFGIAILYYAPLYMEGIGLSSIEMGIVSTVSIFSAFIFHLFAGPVTNKLGRKKTALVFDLLSWTVAMFIWAIAQNFWYFVIAAVINAGSKIVIIATNCLLVEDTVESKRAKVFALLNIVNPVFGLLTPVFGIIISKNGTVPTLRVMYILGMVTMTTLFVTRNLLVHETKAGKALMSKHSKMPVAQNLREYFSTIMIAFKNRNIVLMTIIYTITCFTLSMSFFQVIFLKKSLGFHEIDLSLIPVATALVDIILGLFFVPRLIRFSGEKILTCSMAIRVIGSVLLIFIPGGNIPIMLLAAGILAAGDYLILTYRDAVLMNHVGEHEKADIFSAVQTLNTLVCIPSGFIAGLVFNADPSFPFIINILIFVIALVISFLLIPHSHKHYGISA